MRAGTDSGRTVVGENGQHSLKLIENQ